MIILLTQEGLSIGILANKSVQQILMCLGMRIRCRFTFPRVLAVLAALRQATLILIMIGLTAAAVVAD